MRFDFSYVHLVYALLEGKADLEELLATPAFHLIKKHGELSGMEYDAVVQAVKSVQSGNPNALAQRLLDNKDRVLELVNNCSEQEGQLIAEITQRVREIFPEGNFTEVTIYFIVGYDAIGYGGHVVCSLDLPPILQDTRELISLLIHELTHVIHAQYCPAIRDLSLQKETLQETLDLLIQYEGVAVFSAYPYRVASGILQNTEGAMLQDYVNTPEKEQMLKDAYCRSQRYIAEGRGMDTILETYFSARVDHALGFIIFQNMFKQWGMDRIREMAKLSSSEFARQYLLKCQ